MTLGTPYLPKLASRGDRLFLIRVSDCLRLAPAPTFAIIALFTAFHGASMPNMLCSATEDPSPLTGMLPMYLLMSTFHLAPWLKLISRWRCGA
jgi:hypothetical protein